MCARARRTPQAFGGPAATSAGRRLDLCQARWADLARFIAPPPPDWLAHEAATSAAGGATSSSPPLRGRRRATGGARAAHERAPTPATTTANRPDPSRHAPQYGDTPLHTAARYGHAGVARILLSAKADPNQVNKVSGVRRDINHAPPVCLFGAAWRCHKKTSGAIGARTQMKRKRNRAPESGEREPASEPVPPFAHTHTHTSAPELNRRRQARM